MRTLNTVGLGAILCMAVQVQAQNWLTGGNVTGGGNFLGAAAGSTAPLRLTTIPATLPIEFRTANLLRMRLNPTQTYGTLNGYLNVNADGNLLISPNNNFMSTTVGPFTRLHLADGVSGANNSAAGFRPKMRNGITLTGNQDGMYVGQWYNTPDFTDAVLAWSDNPGSQLTDRMRFLFHSAPTGASSGSQSAEGLEAMRIWPQSFTSAHIGIGDFFAGNLANPAYVTEPTERLDVVNGRVRVRDLPNANNQNDALTKVLVVEDVAIPSNQRGVIRWRDASSLGDPCASGWTLVGNNAVTAYNGNPCPPQDADMVGIGTSAPIAKLHVVKSILADPLVERGIWMQMTTTSANNLGVHSEVTGITNNNNFGVYGLAQNAIRNWGLYGVAASLSNSSAYGGQVRASGGGVNYGLSADALGGSVNYGLNANASGPAGSLTNMGIRASASGPNAWAGWFDGNVQITGNLWNNATLIFSDGSLKTNVEDVAGALDRVLELSPKRYIYDQGAQPQIALPNTPQIGFIAQEVESIVPEAVGYMVYPAQFDTAGVQISEPYPLLGIDYTKLVPLLVGAIQEQHTKIEVLSTQSAEQQERLDQLEQLLAVCCSRSDGSQLAPQDELQKADPGTERLLRIDPNPFTDRTTVSYTLERGGRTMLLVNSSDGKQLQVLNEAVQQAGDYQQEWHTSHLAPGIYYVTLLLDGEPLVKRAVKVR